MNKATLRSFRNHLLFFTSIALPVLLSLLLFVVIPRSRAHDMPLSDAKLFWYTGLIFVVTNVIGFLYGSPHVTDQNNLTRYTETGWPAHAHLVVSYVSRGDNATALKRTVSTTRKVLRTMGVRYTVEVVTDVRVKVYGVDRYTVPANYTTKKGSLYKARALQYLMEQRRIALAHQPNVWILHLDEESVITPEAVAGIAKFVQTHRGKKVIGQGEIKYNAYNYASNLLITCIDSIRTGDDLGRFRMQYKLFKKPLFGMHGSFILLPRTLEQYVGFDLSRKGSITEDAYFALIAMSKGYRFHWVDGFIREQSPFSIGALLKQRRRWIAGLKILASDRDIPLRYRLMLAVNMVLWRVAWVGPIVTIWNLLAGGSLLPLPAAISASILSGVVGSVYMVGALRNVSDSVIANERKVLVWIASLLLFPISCLIEGLAVLYAAVRPVKTFQVVDK